MIEWTAEASEDGTRLDQFIAARAGCSRAAARRALTDGKARINGARARKGDSVRTGDRVRLDDAPPDAAALHPIAEPLLPLEVLHEDAALIAVNKPPGVPTHPLRAGERGTLANAVVARYPECATVGDDPREAGVAHRLDTHTSGLVLVARTGDAWATLRRCFSAGEVGKRYLALVAGTVERDLVVDGPLLHDPADRRRVLVVGIYDDAAEEARPATTSARPIGGAKGLTLLEVTIHTGRMHQIRAHLAHVGHPVVGDPLYGGPLALPDAPGHFLHALRVELAHPTTGATLIVSAPLPPERAAALARLGIQFTVEK